MLNNIVMIVYTMVDNARVKFYQVQSRHSIYLPSDFVRDSAFPFEPGDELNARIVGEKIIIEKAEKPKPGQNKGD